MSKNTSNNSNQVAASVNNRIENSTTNFGNMQQNTQSNIKSFKDPKIHNFLRFCKTNALTVAKRKDEFNDKG